MSSLQISVTRSIYHQAIGRCKTEASRKPVPIDKLLAKELAQWKATTFFRSEEDWVFPSAQKLGTQPLWPDTFLKRHIRPAAKAAGITKKIGWHTFRHTLSTWLKANREDAKVIQEMLRHANSRITMDTYTQAVSGDKRRAQSKIARKVLGARAANAG